MINFERIMSSLDDELSYCESPGEVIDVCEALLAEIEAIKEKAESELDLDEEDEF